MIDLVKKAIHPDGIHEITFTEHDHKYVDNFGKVYKSTTGVIHHWFPEFDSDRISARYAAKHGLKQEDVLQDWEDNKNESCRFGTQVHLYGENKMIGEPLPKPTNKKEEIYFKVLDKFINNQLSKLELIESEKIIFSPKYGLSGTVDLIMRGTKGNFQILDWKTNKEIKKRNYFGEMGHGELSHLDNCNFVHYTLQLNIYRRMLEEEGYFDEDEDKVKMNLLYVTAGGVEIIPVERMDKEVDVIMNGLLKNDS